MAFLKVEMPSSHRGKPTCARNTLMLLHKNWLLKLRAPIGALLEICLPFAFVLLMLWLKGLFHTDVVGAALHLDSDLDAGASGGCETFLSPCLASGERFQVVALEVWACRKALFTHAPAAAAAAAAAAAGE